MFMRKSVVKHDISFKIDCPGVAWLFQKAEDLYEKALGVSNNSP